ncbi:MAG TPA: DUF1987 domain-containing protein [Bacteroidales bacterium]
MENLTIERTQRTPYVDFNISGELLIEGRSTPENSVEFYSLLINWLKNFQKTKPAKINLHVKLEFFNTSSGKLLINMFKQIERFRTIGANPGIIWYYDPADEDMFQSGCDFQSIVQVPFSMVKN